MKTVTAAARIESFFDPTTSTVSYVIAEGDGARAAIVDPTLDFEPRSGRTATASADRIVDYVRRHRLAVEWILETHAHADHLSAAPYLKKTLGGRIAIGAHIVEVQRTFARLFNLGPEFEPNGAQFDRLFGDGDTFAIGALAGRVMHTPGHTPACVTYLIGDAAFVGDTLFMPDYGTARADFPGGDARMLHRSIRRILSLPPETRLFLCHDYPPEGRAPKWQTTVAEQRQANIHVRDSIGEDEFVAMRTARDRTLAMPTLLLPSIQVNIRAGAFPPPESNGISYLKLPLNAV